MTLLCCAAGPQRLDFPCRARMDKASHRPFTGHRGCKILGLRHINLHQRRSRENGCVKRHWGTVKADIRASSLGCSGSGGLLPWVIPDRQRVVRIDGRSCLLMGCARFWGHMDGVPSLGVLGCNPSPCFVLGDLRREEHLYAVSGINGEAF